MIQEEGHSGAFNDRKQTRVLVQDKHAEALATCSTAWVGGIGFVQVAALCPGPSFSALSSSHTPWLLGFYFKPSESTTKYREPFGPKEGLSCVCPCARLNNLF